MKKILIMLLALGMSICAFADTKEESRAAKKAEGFAVEPVAEWDLVSDVDGTKAYDVNFEYNGTFATAKVKVVNDGLPTETAEVVAKLQVPTAPVETFTDRLATFLRSMEKGPVFAISRENVNEADATATVLVYQELNGKVTETRYIVRERAGVFSFKEIV